MTAVMTASASRAEVNIVSQSLPRLTSRSTRASLLVVQSAVRNADIYSTYAKGQVSLPDCYQRLHIRWFSADDGDVFGTWSDSASFSDENASTSIRSILVVDLDGDGFDDIVGTIDRTATHNDALLWLRNTRP